MWKKLEEYRDKYQMLEADDVVIAGVSGGADSMCLLCVLDMWRKRVGFELVVVHVNHGLRGEAADEEECYVKQVCADREIPFEVFHVDIKEVAEKEKISEEEAGRNVRRQAFEEIAKKYQGTRIALAHHKNDNAETFMFHLARGSRLKGLCGMRPVNEQYIRPLLILNREEIEEYLKQNGIRYYVDASNATDQYTRNRIRNHILPYFSEQVNAQTVEHVNQTMEYLHQVHEYLEGQMAILWRDMVFETKEGLVMKQEILMEEELIRKMVIYNMLTQMAGKEKDIQENHVEALEELLKKQTGRRVDLPYQMIAVRSYQGVELRRKTEAAEELPEQRIPLQEGEMQWGDYKIKLRIFECTQESLELPKKVFTKWFDYDILNESVCIRGKKAGDYIVIDKMGRTQKLKQYFINEKIPAAFRGQIPVIAQGAQVLWVVGYRQSKACQVTEQTHKILEITISGGNLDGRED